MTNTTTIDFSGLRPGEAYCVICRERFVLTAANAGGIKRCQDCFSDGGAGRVRPHWTMPAAPYPMTAKGGNP